MADRKENKQQLEVVQFLDNEDVKREIEFKEMNADVYTTLGPSLYYEFAHKCGNINDDDYRSKSNTIDKYNMDL